MAVSFVFLQMPISTGNRRVQTNAMKVYRKQRQYDFRHCQPCYVQLTTTCRKNSINQCSLSRSHTPLVLPSLNNVLPALVLQNRVNIKRSSYISSVCHVSLNQAPNVPTGHERRVVVLLLLLMSGDIETNPGPVGKWYFNVL